LTLGVASAVLGVAFALGQHDLKRLLAYHSVENIGIILIGLGFAYAANSKTSIRAGAGVFYSLSRATVSGHTGAAFNTDAAVPWSLDSGFTRNATLSNPYPQGILTPPGATLGDATFIGLGVGTITRKNRNPEMYSWNFSVQREVGCSAIRSRSHPSVAHGATDARTIGHVITDRTRHGPATGGPSGSVRHC